MQAYLQLATFTSLKKNKMRATQFVSGSIDNKDLKQKKRPLPPRVEQGNILIPDISGFTNFVTQTDLTTGTIITQRLLTAIMESNNLGLKISEIEGDALLLYKFGKRFTEKEVLDQFEKMLSQFQIELALIAEEMGIYPDLSLKLIAHYGSISEYRVLNFQKLYGDSIIEAHVLLKNSIKSDTYALITNELLDDIPSGYLEVQKQRLPGKTTCNLHGNKRELNYSVFKYNKSARQNHGFKLSIS